MHHHALLPIVLCCGLLLSPPSHPTAGEEQEGPSSRVSSAPDAAAIDAVIKAVYDVISGPKGQQRDWERFRALCLPECVFNGIRHIAPDRARSQRMSVDDYVLQAGPYLEANGFFERELHRKLDVYGSIAHAFSSYATFRTAEDKQPFARGINSIQLIKTPQGWKVFSILWQTEADFLPIPAAYLPPQKKK